MLFYFFPVTLNSTFFCFHYILILCLQKDIELNKAHTSQYGTIREFLQVVLYSHLPAIDVHFRPLSS